MFVVVVVKFPFFSCRHANGRERDFCLLFFAFFLFVSFRIKSNNEERRISFYYCFIVSSFPNENDDDDDTTTDFESF